MNQERRDKLEKISKELADLATELESIKDDEVEANNAKPEHLQDSTAADALQEAYDNVDNATGNIADAIGG